MTVHVIAWYPSCNCTPILFTCHSSNISIAFVTRWMNRRWWYYRKDLCKGKKRKGGGRGGIIGHPIVLFKGYMGGTKWSAMLMVLIVVLFEREELPFFHSSFFFFHTLSLSLSLLIYRIPSIIRVTNLYLHSLSSSSFSSLSLFYALFGSLGALTGLTTPTP